MNFPLSFWDISLWLSFTAIILLITAELTSPQFGKTKLLIHRKRLLQATFAITLLFLITVAIYVYDIIVSL